MAARKHAMIILAILSIAAVFVTACGDDTKDASSSTSASQASIDELTARIQRDEMLTAWITVSNLPLHDLDEELQGGTINGKYVPTLRTLIRVLALTDWTSDTKPVATKLHDEAVILLQALDAGKDAAALKDLSAAMHDAAHPFGPTIGNAIAKDLPANAGGPVPTSTPSADDATTPAAGAATPGHDDGATPDH
jgi:hypothetical protein